MGKEWYVGEVRNTVKRANLMSKGGLHDFPPAILSCAITGGMHSKSANPNLPESIDEQVQAVYDAYNAGAVLVHIHTRDPKNLSQMSMDPATYKEINARVREKCPDIIINNTFVGARMYFVDRPAAPVWQVSASAAPEVASLDICRNLYGAMPFCQTITDCAENIKLLDKYGCKPEVECFDLGDIKFLNDMIKQGMLKTPYWVQLIFNSTGITPCIESLQYAERMLPEESLMSVIPISTTQTPICTAALLMGHHVRVGLEDNVYYEKGVLAESNAQLVERMVRIARDIGRPLTTPAQAREMMGLGAPRQYTFDRNADKTAYSGPSINDVVDETYEEQHKHKK